MEFNWPIEYTDYKDQVVAFVSNQINPLLSDPDKKYDFPKEAWIKCAEFGIQGLASTANYGGSHEIVNFSRAMLAMEGFGYACHSNSLPFGLNAQMWTVQTPLLKFGNEIQKAKFLTKMVMGEAIGAHGLTEPDYGSDVYNMKTKAQKVEGGYLLNGVKHLITLAPIADLAIILAITNKKLGKWGMSAFIIEKDMNGLNIHPRKMKMGLNHIPIGGYEFKDCFVPDENLIGKEGLGFSILNHSLEYDRCCILASHLGAMESQLERTIKKAKTRKQFGKNIGKFQSVSNRIVDMKLRLETSRLLLYKTVWLKESGNNSLIEGALLKLHLSESFLQSSLDSMRTFGGIGYLSETGVEEDVRDSIGGVLYAGTSDIQRNIVASLLGL